MTKILVKTYSAAREHKVFITKVLICGCIAVALLYAINLYAIISRTVATKEVESAMTALADSVKDLDAQYIALSNKITPEMAQIYGLEQSDAPTYIERDRSLGNSRSALTEL